MIRRQKLREEACLAELDPPIKLDMPDSWSRPVIFSSPHSGRIYPKAFKERSDQSQLNLRRNEDAFVDELFASVPSQGAPLLSARFPRCFVDVNRSPNELPQKWLPRSEVTTARAEMGLGVIPTMLGENQPIYKRPLRQSVVKARIKALYNPYHKTLRKLIDQGVTDFGHVLLIDCHSMPGFTGMGVRRPDIILGDRYGSSCHPETISKIEYMFKAADYSVARNYPYAGSYVTSHYGRPQDGVETVQIEINRDLYLNSDTLEPHAGFDLLSRKLTEITYNIISSIGSSDQLAAE